MNERGEVYSLFEQINGARVKPSLRDIGDSDYAKALELADLACEEVIRALQIRGKYKVTPLAAAQGYVEALKTLAVEHSRLHQERPVSDLYDQALFDKFIEAARGVQ